MVASDNIYTCLSMEACLRQTTCLDTDKNICKPWWSEMFEKTSPYPRNPTGLTLAEGIPHHQSWVVRQAGVPHETWLQRLSQFPHHHLKPLDRGLIIVRLSSF
jgi:hypothetical protein